MMKKEIRRAIVFISLIVFISSCSRMRLDYGFNPRNRTIRCRTITKYPSGQVEIIRMGKSIYPKNTMDAAWYHKNRTKYFYENGKIKSLTIEEEIGSVWGNRHVKGISKEFSETGEMKKNKYEDKKAAW